jgi:hypothetical protein
MRPDESRCVMCQGELTISRFSGNLHCWPCSVRLSREMMSPDEVEIAPGRVMSAEWAGPSVECEMCKTRIAVGTAYKTSKGVRCELCLVDDVELSRVADAVCVDCGEAHSERRYDGEHWVRAYEALPEPAARAKGLFVQRESQSPAAVTPVSAWERRRRAQRRQKKVRR